MHFIVATDDTSLAPSVATRKLIRRHVMKGRKLRPKATCSPYNRIDGGYEASRDPFRMELMHSAATAPIRVTVEVLQTVGKCTQMLQRYLRWPSMLRLCSSRCCHTNVHVSSHLPDRCE